MAVAGANVGSIGPSARLPQNINFLAKTGIPNAETMKSFYVASLLCLKVAKYDKSFYARALDDAKILEDAYPSMAAGVYNSIVSQMEQTGDFIEMADIYVKARAKALNRAK